MKKNRFIIFALLILILFACNRTVIDADLSEITDEDAVITEIAMEESPDEEASDEERSSILSALPVDYSEVNQMIDGVIKQWFMSVFNFIGRCLLIALTFIFSLPVWLKAIIYIPFFTSAITIVYSHALGIYRNRNEWEKHPGHDLSYSYFVYSGNYQRKKSYKEARTLVYDKTWLIASLAGLAYRLGNYSTKSTMVMFLLSFVYIPLSILGFIEMIFRYIFGTIWLFVFGIIHQFLLFLTRLISLVLIPVSRMIDKALLKTQYCPQCYKTISLPYFICPSCKRVHKELIPGRCGVLFARCSCGRKFLPCTVFTGRSRLAAKCNDCETELAAANPRHFSIAVVGGNDCGKTAFIAAFSNLYINSVNRTKHITVKGKPESAFNELSSVFNDGVTKSDTDPCTYSIVHKNKISAKYNLVFYDTLDESILSESFPRSPKYLGYCDGIILIIDPLSVKSVRNEHSKTLNGLDNEEHSEDDIDHLTNQFINLYFRIRGYSTGNMCDVPVAVLINKTDIPVVKQEIDMDAAGGGAKDDICTEYLRKIGLQNLLNNIEASFSNVSFFPVSAIGHSAQNGKKFTPIGVIKPVAWIAKKGKSGLFRYLSKLD